MQITINIPDVIGVMRAKTSVSVDATKLSAEIIARLVEHGIVQKVGDAAAGAGKAAEEANMTEVAYATSAMMKVVDMLYTGTWGATRGGGGMTDQDRAEYYVAEQAIRAKIGAEAWKALDDEARVARTESAIEKLLAKDADAFKAAVEARVAHVVEQRKKRENEKKVLAAMGADIDV